MKIDHLNLSKTNPGEEWYMESQSPYAYGAIEEGTRKVPTLPIEIVEKLDRDKVAAQFLEAQRKYLMLHKSFIDLSYKTADAAKLVNEAMEYWQSKAIEAESKLFKDGCVVCFINDEPRYIELKRDLLND